MIAALTSIWFSENLAHQGHQVIISQCEGVSAEFQQGFPQVAVPAAMLQDQEADPEGFFSGQLGVFDPPKVGQRIAEVQVMRTEGVIDR